jgi:hypothetical protein
MTLPASPVREVVAASLVLAGTLFAVVGHLASRPRAPSGRAARRDPRPERMDHCPRDGAFALGVVTTQPGLIVLGAAFLAEELYETGVVVLLIRSQDTYPHRQ